jgi:hypothetical protein
LQASLPKEIKLFDEKHLDASIDIEVKSMKMKKVVKKKKKNGRMVATKEYDKLEYTLSNMLLPTFREEASKQE